MERGGGGAERISQMSAASVPSEELTAPVATVAAVESVPVTEAAVASEGEDLSEGVETSLPVGEELSKKAKKRLARKAKWEQQKIDRKLKEKADKAALRVEREAKRAAEGESGGDVKRTRISDPDQPTIHPIERRRHKDVAFVNSMAGRFEVIIDMDWESDHNTSSLSSLTQQVMFCYGANRRAKMPVRMSLTNVGGQTEANLQKVNFRNWYGFDIYSEDMVDIPRFSTTPLGEEDIAWSPPPVPSEKTSIPSEEAGEEKADDAVAPQLDARSIQPAQRKELIYLTSDSTELLTELNPNHAYIIGGIVDRNRLKGITAAKAQRLGLRTAALPIKEHLKLAATHVLTINHVFDILLRVSENGGDWAAAMESVLPRRKEAVQKSQIVNEDGESKDNIEEVNSDEPSAESTTVDKSSEESEKAIEGEKMEVV